MSQADEDLSSGMCKAGFAGDDAPRAVFRKSPFISSYVRQRCETQSRWLT